MNARAGVTRPPRQHPSILTGWTPPGQLFRSGRRGKVLHLSGCVMLVRPEQVSQTDDGRSYRHCPRCWPTAA